MRRGGWIYRPRTLAVVFGCYFAVVMLESWMFASGLRTPWYGPDLSRWVYMSFVVSSAVFITGAGILAFHILNALGSQVREVNRELGVLLWGTGTLFSSAKSFSEPSDPHNAGDDEAISQDLDEMLEVLGEADAQLAQGVLVESGDGTLEESDPVEATREGTRRRDLVHARQRLKQHQDFLLRFLPGPVGVAVGILGISMAMIPASDGMLQTSYQLNTSIILGFAYGWVGLAAYFAASILGIVMSLRSDRKRRVRRTEE